MQISQFSGKPIDQEAIELLRAYEPPTGYYLGDSGGRDSAVCRDLLIRSGVRFDAHYNVSPVDPPQVRDYLANVHPDTIWDYHARGFFGKVESNGLPLRTQRWCCRLIKEVGGQGRVKVLGMRNVEALGNPRGKYNCYREMPDDTLWILPIIRWTLPDVKQYITERAIPINRLYSMGFTRTGCILCPNQSKDDVALSLHYFPKIVNCWRLAGQRYFARRSQKPGCDFRDAEEMFQWWIGR